MGLQHCCRVTKWDQTLCHKSLSHLWAKPRPVSQPHTFYQHFCQICQFLSILMHSSILTQHLQIPLTGGTEHLCHQQSSTPKALGLSALPRHYFLHKENAVEGLFRHTDLIPPLLQLCGPRGLNYPASFSQGAALWEHLHVRLLWTSSEAGS